MKKIEHQKSFFCNDGQVFTTPNELVSGLRNMSFQTFRFHANASKNDFSQWLRDVFGFDDLSKLIHNSKTKAQTIKVLKEYMNKPETKIQAFYSDVFE